ncbi:head GIN domain-containing protein [Sphingomicrobium flavum]|uniref:head GIN domain-containing protein n=1 Tax=Sphingomicrobium flavum TaxID=1229164 RepID=UPI0021ADE349|nr:head GIN domain-containing protein [Sphingomicrobium flavum]
MKKIIALAAAAATLSACNMSFGSDEDAGPADTRTQSVTGFDRLAVSGAYNVDVKTGQDASIEMTGPKNILDATEISVEDGLLKIGTKKGKWNWRGGGDVQVSITVPMLNEARLAGASDITIDRVEGESFTGAVSGAGDMTIDQVQVGTLSMGISGAGDLKAAGTADRLKISISGAGDFGGSGLTARTAEITVSGAGGAEANVTETVEATVSGAGSIDISGGAKCTSRTSGAGTVNCG